MRHSLQRRPRSGPATSVRCAPHGAPCAARSRRSIGTGYLGATHAAGMAELGHDVLGVDVDAAKVAALAPGEVPFYEPGLRRAARAQRRRPGRLRFTTDFAEAAEFGDVHFVCVGTPQRPGANAADLSLRRRRRRRAGPAPDPPGARRRQVDRARSAPPSALARPAAPLAPGRRGRRPGLEPGVPARGLRRRRTPCAPTGSSIGVDAGAADADEDVCARSTRRMLEPGTPFLVTDFATAELVKVAANAFLATKISFINAMAEVCEATGADVTAAGRRRSATTTGSARKFLKAGLGFGGGCLPKDIRAFMARAGELGARRQRWRSCARSTRSTCAGAPRWSTLARELARRQRSSGSASPCWARRSSPTATTSATPPPSTSPPRSAPAGADVVGVRPARPWTTPGAAARR